MPKKSIKDYKTKRRDIWKTKSAKRNGEDKKIGNNVYIGAGNAKRWVILKKKLDYMSDKDFVTYLLDLADPHGGLNELSTTHDEADKDDGPAFRSKDTNRTEVIESPSRSPSDVDDREWHPQGLDDRLRRSPRKQSKSHVRRSGRKSQSEKKTKTHKKKKRKKVDKVAPEDEVEENAVVSEPEPEPEHETNDVVDTIEEGPPTLEAEPVDRMDDPLSVEETEMPKLEPRQSEVQPEEEVPIEREPGEVRTVLVMKGDVHIEVGERVKLKRREKHRRSSSQDPPDKHKHKKKKHRHGEHGAKRKHHDIRKAPQDGVPCSPPASEVASPAPPPPAPPSPIPVRAIFKTKLCANCNRRHAPLACPLLTPARIIRDAVPFTEWEANRKATAKPDDDEDEDDNSNNLEIDDIEREPTFAIASLPQGFYLQVIDPTHGFSVLTTRSVPPFTQLGPLIGQSIKEMDIPDDFNMKDIWETTPLDSKERAYLSTVDPNQSNWLRYLRPAPSRDQRNIAPIVRGDQLMFYTMMEIADGNELLYWADHLPTWSKKKMEKTNCGGCNLRFSHPLYYRLHCAVFHDPNFSLTIRKYHCKVCGAAVLGKENIMRHASEQHDGKGAYRCQFCNKFFLRLNYLEMHRTYGCAANPQRTRPLCDFCGRKFCQPQKLKVHIKRMHSDMAEVLREFQCKICLKLLGSRAALQRHMKEVHHKDIVGACTCDRCGKMFQNKSNLKIHMLTHSGVKPFKCRQTSCNAAFTTKQCLQFHYKKVHSFSELSMPTIERSVAYTFDAYSGNKGGEKGRGRGRGRGKSSSCEDENEDSLLTMMDGDSSSSNMTAADVSSSNPETCNNVTDEQPPNLSPPDHPSQPKSPVPNPPTLDPYPTYSKLEAAPPPPSPPRYETPPYEAFCEKPRSPPPEVEYAYGKPPSRASSPLLEPYPRCHHPMEGQELEAYSYGKPKSPEQIYGNSYGKPKSPETVYGNSYGESKSPEPGYGNSYGKPKSPEPVYGNSYGKPKSPEPVYGNSYGKPKSPEVVYGNSYTQSQGPSRGPSPHDMEGYAYGKGSPDREEYNMSYKKADSDLEPYYGKVLSKGSKKWMGDHSVSLSPRSPPIDEVVISVGKPAPRDPYEDKREVYEFENEKCTIEIVKMVQCEEDKRDKLRVKPLSSFRRPDSSTASLLVEAALDAAQRDIIDAAPSVIMTQLESQMDYMPDELSARHRVSPGTLAHMEGAGYRLAPPPPDHYLRQEAAPHLADNGAVGYGLHYDDEPASPSVTPRSHGEYAQQDLGSPASGAPSLRYDLRQVEGLSSDEESLVAQNLTKEKALQLYDVEDQGLDMSRSAPYHPFNAPLPPRYHLYDDRYSPPAYPDVVRVVSLDLTPGRHTVDLSLPRSSHHHPHHHLHQSRLLSSPPLAPPMANQNLMSPPPHNSYPTYLPPSPRSSQPQGYHHYSGYY